MALDVHVDARARHALRALGAACGRVERRQRLRPPLHGSRGRLDQAAQDVPIEGTDHGFETLKAAQAIGDLATLRAHGLPAERVTLHGEDPVAALRALTERIRTLLSGT